MPIRNVQDIVAGRQLFSIGLANSVVEISNIMRQRSIGALAVLDAGKLVGIVSERDVVHKVVALGLDPRLADVASIMTLDPICVCPGQSLDVALKLMKEGKFRHLPVVSGMEATGMISMRDIPVENQFLYERFEARGKSNQAFVPVGSDRRECMEAYHDASGPSPSLFSNLTHLMSAS